MDKMEDLDDDSFDGNEEEEVCHPGRPQFMPLHRAVKRLFVTASRRFTANSSGAGRVQKSGDSIGCRCKESREDQNPNRR